MDAVGGSVVSTSRTIDKLVSLLTEEARLLKGIRRSEIESLKDELEILRLYLRDVDSKSTQEELSDAVKEWSSQLKEVAELIEDVMDEYVLKASQRRHQRGFVRFLGRAGRLIGTLNSRSNLSSNIQNIKTLLYEIKEQGQAYGLNYLVSDSRSAVKFRSRFMMTPFSLETRVDIDSTASELMQRLVEGASKRSVISLVGVGGIGKTTLAKKVYDDVVVIRGHFDCHAWITVTQSYNLEELLRNMLRQIGAVGVIQEVLIMRREELIEIVRQYLQSKRYLLVFDDAWQEQFWKDVKHALPENEKGSRIIVTTRSDIVAASCIKCSFDHVHMVQPLSEENSWKLFCSRAFPLQYGLSCPPELKELSHQFIRMCGGLPLAIVTIAGLLSTKERTISEWRKLLATFQFQLRSDPHLSNVPKILAFCFHDLHYKLKVCFMYFSIFAQDSLVPTDKLMKLWIAEGFVQETHGHELEHVAEEYLTELIQRNLVQFFERSYGLEKFCQVHDLMHDIARQKADGFGFCQIRDDKNSSLSGKSRRLSISNNVEENVLQTIEDCQVRSVFLSNLGALNSSFVVMLLRKYKLLTLLDFENVPLDHLPEEVGNLFHLKYLSLKNTKVKALPKSVGKLQKLQTLDLRNTLLVELPIEINMLQNLRHLLASDYDSNMSLYSTQGVRIKEGIGNLANLQTLMTVEALLTGMDLKRELEKLRELRRLGISGLTTEVVSAICPSIEKMHRLEYLSLQLTTDYEIMDLQSIFSPPQLLQHLILKGRLQRFPDWVVSLQNLTMLCLSLSRLTDDPLRHICVLPRLVSLWLYQAYEGERLHFVAGGFARLKLLALRNLQALEAMKIDEGALPLLDELRIGPSPRLVEVPYGIQHLINLRVLAFYDMSNELVLSIQPDGGSDYWKVQHIPSVLFWYKVQRRSYALYELGDSDLLDRLQGSATNINDVVQHAFRLSFSYSNDEEDSASASISVVPWGNMRPSFSSDQCSFFSDDIED